MTRPSNTVECWNCHNEFIPDVDVEKLPMFNSARKGDWKPVECPGCGNVIMVARWSKKLLEVYSSSDYKSYWTPKNPS